LSITLKLSQFINNTKYENLPEEIIHQTKDCILDTLGGAIAALNYEDVNNLIKTIKTYDQQTDCTIWGTTNRFSLLNAVLLNGILSHTVEIDDVHRNSKNHAGTIVIPTAITLGEKMKISGKKLIEAVLVGYEVDIKIGLGLNASSHRLRGWFSTSTCGSFGSAAAASKIFNFDINQTQSSLGIAGVQTNGLWTFTDECEPKKFLVGNAARSGVLGCILVSGGMHGPKKILEAEDGGLLHMTSDQYDYDIITDALGEKYEIMNVDRKPYACCRSMHPSIDAVIALRNEGNIDIKKIREIIVETYEIAIKQCGVNLIPEKVSEARFSIPFGVAVAFYDGEVSIQQMNNERLKDGKLKQLAKKVKLVQSDIFTKIYPECWGCLVRVKMDNNQSYEKKILIPTGDFRKPLTKDQLIDKFKSLTSYIFLDEKQHKIIDSIQQLEQMENIQELTSLLQKNN